MTSLEAITKLAEKISSASGLTGHKDGLAEAILLELSSPPDDLQDKDEEKAASNLTELLLGALEGDISIG